MAVEITGRHVDVSDSMRDYAQKRVAKLMDEFPHVDKVHVIMDIQKYVHMAEAIIHASRHILVEAKAQSENMYASIDEVVDKVERQLRRTIDKRHGHKGDEKLRDVEAIPEA